MHEELLSVVIAPGKDPEQVFRTLDQLAEFLPSRFKNFEIIAVCDNSNPTFAYTLSERVASTRNLRVLTLARHYGSAIATLAGLQHAIGDYTVLLSAEAAPDVIDDLFLAMTPDHDVVFAVDEMQQDAKDRILRGVEKLSQIPMVIGHASAALMRRQSLNAILTLRERIVHLPLLASYLGLRIATIPTAQTAVLSKTRLLQQLEAICAYSPWPLIVMASLVLGLTGIATLLSFLQWIISGFEGDKFLMFFCMLGVTGIAG